MTIDIAEFTFRALVGYAYILAIGWGVTRGRKGSISVATIPILVSIIGMGVVRAIWERNSPLTVADMYNPATQSWAFLFGDLLALPMALGFSAVAWRKMSSSSWFWSDAWAVVAIISGILISLMWHHLLEAPAYTAAGFEDMLETPTKIWHDTVVYGILSTLLIYLGVPAVITDWRRTGGAAVMAFVVWGALGFADATVHELHIPDLHPPHDTTSFAR